MSNTFYNEILIEHNLHPTHKHDLPDANLVLEGVNPSCGDDIWLKLKVENDEIVDGAFVGDGCAMPARVKCAVLGWHTMEEMFKKAAEGKMIPDSYSK